MDIRIVLPALLIGARGACAPLPQRLDVAWRQGAKPGRVAGFCSAATPRADLPPYLASLPPAELATRRDARSGDRHARRLLVDVADLPPELPARLGDRLEPRRRTASGAGCRASRAS